MAHSMPITFSFFRPFPRGGWSWRLYMGSVSAGRPWQPLLLRRRPCGWRPGGGGGRPQLARRFSAILKASFGRFLTGHKIAVFANGDIRRGRKRGKDVRKMTQACECRQRGGSGRLLRSTPVDGIPTTMSWSALVWYALFSSFLADNVARQKC